MDRRSALRLALAGVAASTGVVVDSPAIAGKPTPPAPRDVVCRKWSSDADFATGVAAGVGITGGVLTLSSAIGQRTYTDPFTGSTGSYDYATWTSPEVQLGFAATEAIASWTASTPGWELD